jgi:hypothetical protein
LFKEAQLFGKHDLEPVAFKEVDDLSLVDELATWKMPAGDEQTPMSRHCRFITEDRPSECRQGVSERVNDFDTSGFVI